MQTASHHVPTFAAGRFVVGLGVGSAAMIVPLYIGEIAPAKYRRRMIAFNNMSVTFGQFVASSLGAGFAHVPGEGWRGNVAVGALSAILLAILLFWCPDSPRQLIAHGNRELADICLLKVYPSSTPGQRSEKIRAVERSIQKVNASMTEESVWKTLKRIFTTPATGRAVFTACMIMAISQLGAFSTLMYYSATLFKIVGYSNATAVAIIVSGTNFVFSGANLLLVDRLRRRAILRITVFGMAICLLIAAVAFHHIPINISTLEVERDTVGWPGILVLVTIIVYVRFYSSGVATIAWIGVELIPMEVRAVGAMMNIVTCWSTNIIIASTFLSMMKGLTPTGAFGFYCGICFVGWIFVLFCFPEVRGMPFEAVREVFANGFGVKYSRKWQKEKRHLAKFTRTQSFGH